MTFNWKLTQLRVKVLLQRLAPSLTRIVYCELLAGAMVGIINVIVCCTNLSVIMIDECCYYEPGWGERSQNEMLVELPLRVE